ncbi:cyclic nucleotide-binding protein [Lysobacteraceae bacterium NML08-0793]|nr:cyclic nucleotide-binding protein [Xanthomonadaceae bacterium NML08-0793]
MIMALGLGSCGDCIQGAKPAHPVRVSGRVAARLLNQLRRTPASLLAQSRKGKCSGKCHNGGRCFEVAQMEPVPGLDLSLPPFDLLDDEGRSRLAASVDLAFHRAGDLLIAAGQPSPHAVVVMKGRIYAFDMDGAGHERRFGDYDAGDVFGAWAVMAGRARHSYRAESDCLLFLIPAEVFRELIEQYPAFRAYFNEGLSAKGQLADRNRGRDSELAELMIARVGDAHLAPAEHIEASASIRQASALLKARRVDCLLVDDAAHAAPGIVTRTDLLEAITLKDIAADAAVGTLANRPLIAVQAGDALFQALIVMTERHIERVAVVDGDRILGTLGMAEVLSHYASHSHLISLRLARANTLEEIADAASGMTRLVRTLHAQGARIPYLMELVSALNSRIMQRVFEWVVPKPYHDQLCLLLLGSEGRREQLLKTDQDNALIVADTLQWDGLEAAMQQFSAALAQMGYPPCPGGVMVSNAHWCMRASQWRERIMSWRYLHTPEAALDLAITLDSRPVAGNQALFAPLQEALQALGEDARLLNQLAAATLRFETPLTLLGHVKSDAHGTDLKKGGIFPVVHGLRCMALKYGISERNSFERCEKLVALGRISAALGRDLPQALSVFQRLRLDAQIAALDAGRLPDNLIHAERLRRLDRELLRDALRVVKGFRQQIKTEFHLTE